MPFLSRDVIVIIKFRNRFTNRFTLFTRWLIFTRLEKNKRYASGIEFMYLFTIIFIYLKQLNNYGEACHKTDCSNEPSPARSLVAGACFPTSQLHPHYLVRSTLQNNFYCGFFCILISVLQWIHLKINSSLTLLCTHSRR